VAEETILIDGSQGEGGGQILRTSVGLAAALGLGVRITSIRARRKPAGLRAQHLAAVRAAATICQAQVTGDRIGSSELTFLSGEVRPGPYQFDIGTAGSAVLVIQTILPALMLADGESGVTVTGGTHNPFAPCFHYLRDVFAVLASACNLQAYFEMERAAFFPRGGGSLRMQIRGVGSSQNVEPMGYVSRGDLRYIEGISAAGSSLPGHVVERQTTQALGRLAAAAHRATIEQAVWDTASPGTVVFLRTVFTRTVAGFFALGARGKPAERVADEAVEPLLAFLQSTGAVDAHAADQLITLSALCPDESRFLTERVTDHLLTNAQVIRQMTGRNVRIEGEAGQEGMVTVERL